jgi:hypothetical protein
MPPNIRKFHENNNITVFVYSKKNKEKADPTEKNEFKVPPYPSSSSPLSLSPSPSLSLLPILWLMLAQTLWLTHYFYQIDTAFPTIHKRAEIINRVEVPFLLMQHVSVCTCNSVYL